MARKQEPPIDPRLWFTMEPACQGKHYLLWASHTFPGRFTAWCPIKKRTTNCSKSDVQKCSKEAAYWLKGFLAGNTPEPPQSSEGSDAEFKAWERAALRFQKTGMWRLP
jgi:hypothetical protein